jgi:hypothetical protein
MKTAFLTESQFQAKVPLNCSNMRTEMAWQAALQSDHFNIFQYEQVKDYDAVFVIFPKALVKLNMIGIEMDYANSRRDCDNIKIYSLPVIETLKKNNKRVCYIQEGPTNVFNDYDLPNQFNFYNQLSECDIIFAHNEYDTHFYKGLFPRSKVYHIPTLMIVNNDTCPFHWNPENKTIISGNFAAWYGGFQSYLVATEFNYPIFVPASHCKRPNEEQVPNLHHMPWVDWTQWMKQLSQFKYAVSMMPTIAAGTFSANCAYYGIPCIGNEKVDTQAGFFPELSVDVHDIYESRHLAAMLREDATFYEQCSNHAKLKFKNSVNGNPEAWLENMKSLIYE